MKYTTYIDAHTSKTGQTPPRHTPPGCHQILRHVATFATNRSPPMSRLRGTRARPRTPRLPYTWRDMKQDKTHLQKHAGSMLLWTRHNTTTQHVTIVGDLRTSSDRITTLQPMNTVDEDLPQTSPGPPKSTPKGLKTLLKTTPKRI